MPTYPIDEQIAQLVKTALETVDGTGAFQTTVSEVLRLAKTGVQWVAKDFQCVLMLGDPVRWPEGDYEGNPVRIGWQQPYEVYCYVRPGDDSKTPIDETLSIFRADVTKAVMADIQWNSLAANTKVAASAYLRPGDGSYEGVLVIFDVFYRVDEDDPYSQT